MGATPWEGSFFQLTQQNSPDKGTAGSHYQPTLTQLAVCPSQVKESRRVPPASTVTHVQVHA